MRLIHLLTLCLNVWWICGMNCRILRIIEKIPNIQAIAVVIPEGKPLTKPKPKTKQIKRKEYTLRIDLILKLRRQWSDNSVGLEGFGEYFRRSGYISKYKISLQNYKLSYNSCGCLYIIWNINHCMTICTNPNKFAKHRLLDYV